MGLKITSTYQLYSKYQCTRYLSYTWYDVNQFKQLERLFTSKMTFNRHQDKSSSFTFYILVYWLCREFLFYIIFFSINPFLFHALSLTRVNRLNNLLPSIPEPRLAWFLMPPLSLSYAAKMYTMRLNFGTVDLWNVEHQSNATWSSPEVANIQKYACLICSIYTRVFYLQIIYTSIR